MNIGEGYSQKKARGSPALSWSSRREKLDPPGCRPLAFLLVVFVSRTCRVALKVLSSCLDHAVAVLCLALALDPAFAMAWNGKGIALNELNRSQEAIDAYALALDPTNTSAWSNKGAVLHSLKRSQEAIDAYDHALALDPTDAIAWSNKAIALRHLGRRKEANAADQRAQKLRGS